MACRIGPSTACCRRKNDDKDIRNISVDACGGRDCPDAVHSSRLSGSGDDGGVHPRAQDAGANLIEIGFPFSDPIADGPTIQQAFTYALERGVRVSQVIQTVKAIKRRVPRSARRDAELQRGVPIRHAKVHRGSGGCRLQRVDSSRSSAA